METMMHTMNPDTAISRAEAALERQADVVSRGEFRLLLWMGAFVLTAILGGMTVLYTGVETQLDAVETRLGGVETRLDSISPPPV